MIESRKQTAARTPLSHAVEQWSGYCQRYSPSTRLTYPPRLALFKVYGHLDSFDQITAEGIYAFVNSLLSRFSATTVNGYLTAIKSFCRWFCELHDLPNPAARVKFFRPDSPVPRCLSQLEYEQICRRCDSREIQIIKFLCHTGLRANEFCTLTAENVRGPWMRITGKGRKIRTIPLNKTALESLPYVIGFNQTTRTLTRICHDVATAAAVVPFSAHACRHYFATALLAKGTPIHLVSKLLGHSSVVVTEKTYYHFRPDHLAGTTDCLQ